jgi:hypothetical protein
MHEGDVCDHCGAMADAHGVLWHPDSDDSDDALEATRALALTLICDRVAPAEPEAACDPPR